MARYKVQTPDGNIITVEGPDGASQADVIAQAQSLYNKPAEAKKTGTMGLAETIGREFNAPNVKIGGVSIPGSGKAVDVAEAVDRGLIANTLGAPVDIINLGLQGVDWAANKLAKATGMPEEKPWATAKPVGGGEWIQQQMENAGLVSPTRRPILETAAGLAPIAPSVAKGVYNVGREIAQVPISAAKGALLNEPGTSLFKVGDYYVKPEAVNRYKLGYLTKDELSLPENLIAKEQLFTSPMDKAALKIAGNQVPARGKIAEATGERIAQDYGGDLGAIKFMADVGVPAVTGLPPLFASKRVVQGLADRYLGTKYDFDPDFLAKLRADTGAAPTSIYPVAGARPAPPAPPAPPAGPVAPTPPPPAAPNINTPAYQRANKSIPGVNAPVAPTPAPPKPPAVQAAETYGITPPSNAVQSGFSQELGTLAKNEPVSAPVAPEALGFEYAPKQAIDWKGNWAAPVTTAEPAPSQGMMRLRQALQSMPEDLPPGSIDATATPVLTKAQQIAEQIRQRAKAATPVETTTSARPVRPVAEVKTPLPNVNPEIDVASVGPSASAIKQRLENQTLGQQLATEFNIEKQANRSNAQMARGSLVDDIKGATNVTKSGGKLTYNKDMFNDLAKERGLTIDWSQAPDIKNMGLGEGRREMKKFVYGQLSPTRRSSNKVSDDVLNTLFEEVPSTPMTTRPNNPNIMSMMAEEPRATAPSAPAGSKGTFENPFPNKETSMQGQGLFDALKNGTPKTYMEGNTKVQTIPVPETKSNLTVRYGKEGNLNVTKMTGKDPYGFDTETVIKHKEPHVNIQDELELYPVDDILRYGPTNYQPTSVFSRYTNPKTGEIIIHKQPQGGVDIMQGFVPKGMKLGNGRTAVQDTWEYSQGDRRWINSQWAGPGPAQPHPLGNKWNKPLE